MVALADGHSAHSQGLTSPSSPFDSFAQADIRPFAESLLVALFTTIERGQTPEEISKNDHLMRCGCCARADYGTL